MSSLLPNNIHFIPKGKLGVVIHPDGPTKTQVDCWVKDHDPMPSRDLWSNKTSLLGESLALNYTIPYAATVLVLSSPLLLTGKDSFYYHVLHGEVECWIRTDYLLNPFY